MSYKVNSGHIDGVPLSLIPEAQDYLLSPEALLALGKGTLADSMWAPGNEHKLAKCMKNSKATAARKALPVQTAAKVPSLVSGSVPPHLRHSQPKPQADMILPPHLRGRPVRNVQSKGEVPVEVPNLEFDLSSSPNSASIDHQHGTKAKYGSLGASPISPKISPNTQSSANLRATSATSSQLPLANGTTKLVPKLCEDDFLAYMDMKTRSRKATLPEVKKENIRATDTTHPSKHAATVSTQKHTMSKENIRATDTVHPSKHAATVSTPKHTTSKENIRVTDTIHPNKNAATVSTQKQTTSKKTPSATVPVQTSPRAARGKRRNRKSSSKNSSAAVSPRSNNRAAAVNTQKQQSSSKNSSGAVSPRSSKQAITASTPERQTSSEYRKWVSSVSRPVKDEPDEPMDPRVRGWYTTNFSMTGQMGEAEKKFLEHMDKSSTSTQGRIYQRTSSPVKESQAATPALVSPPPVRMSTKQPLKKALATDHEEWFLECDKRKANKLSGTGKERNVDSTKPRKENIMMGERENTSGNRENNSVKILNPVSTCNDHNTLASTSKAAATAAPQEIVRVDCDDHHSKISDAAWHMSSKLLQKSLERATSSGRLPEIDDAAQLATVTKLTEDALIEKTGQAPKDWTLDSFDDRVSDIESVPIPKENVRAKQGKAAGDYMLDWDGVTWTQPVLDWENDRTPYDCGYMTAYIHEWNAATPKGEQCRVDHTHPDFALGHPISNKQILKVDYDHESFPNTTESENEPARLQQTAYLEAIKRINRIKKYSRATQRQERANAIRDYEIETRPFEPHPFAPKIDIYLRPATINDVRGITEIYNYYVAHSSIPEDQEQISIDTFKALLKSARDEKAPFIVAIQGNLPNIPQPHLRKSKNVTLPTSEKVLGFAFAKSMDNAFGGLRTGRSRYTGKLHLYVHNQYTRKGIGRSLLDRLLQTMTHCYGAKDGYSWLNMDNDACYQQGGGGRWHQVLIELPVLPKDDPDLAWKKAFLQNYYFKDEARLQSVARSSSKLGMAQFLDIVVFQSETSPAGEFDPIV